VFPPLLRVLPNIHECFYNLIETRSTCFLFLLSARGSVEIGSKSWRYTAAKIWNALPDQFRAANNIGTFKNLMSEMDFSNFTF